MKKLKQYIIRIFHKLKHRFLVWKHETFFVWFKKHKEHVVFTTLEKANWFPWYGRRVIYVKPKDDSKLTLTERDVKDALRSKDYTRAMEIVNKLPMSPSTVTLKQILAAKIR